MNEEKKRKRVHATTDEKNNEQPTETKAKATKPTKRTRMRMSCEEKLRVVERTKEPNVTVSGVAAEIGIPESTVRKWKKEEDQIRQLMETSKGNGKIMKANYPDLYPTLTGLLIPWADEVLADPALSLNTASIQAQALLFRDEILHGVVPHVTEKEKEALAKFTASDKWARKWAQTRSGIEALQGPERVQKQKELDSTMVAKDLTKIENLLRGHNITTAADLIVEARAELFKATKPARKKQRTTNKKGGKTKKKA